jgi:hypothetical protein
MRKISIVLTVLFTSFVMALAGLVASPIASASENDGSISATFASGSSVLTKAQKAAIKKALASSGAGVTYTVTGTAGKLPGVSDSRVERLAKARAKAIKTYLVSLGVSKTSIKTQASMTEIGVGPKSTGSYPTPAPTPTVTAVATNNAPAAPTLTCATGGTCIVGATGPGGGIVYYVDNLGFSCGVSYTTTGSPTGGKCKYLEVAPGGWNTGADPTKPWAVPGRTSPDVTGITNHTAGYYDAAGIGLGYRNSDLIETHNGVYSASTNNYSAGAARAYAGGSKTDWYLPTTAELNLLCQWDRNVTQVVTTACIGGTINTGTNASGSGFAGSWYWSSSQYGVGNAWGLLFEPSGTVYSDGKGSTLLVRPVRAF